MRRELKRGSSKEESETRADGEKGERKIEEQERGKPRIGRVKEK